MSRHSPFVIELGDEERRVLEARVRKRTAEHRDVLRARIVLAAASGEQNASIAERLGIALNTMIKWRKRFFEEGMAGLEDRKRPGRPRAFPPQVVVQVKAVACELPSRRNLPLSRFSLSEVRGEVLASGIVAEIGLTTIWRWLDEDAIRPWQHRSWIAPRAPDFAAKAAVVLDLYAGIYRGRALRSRDYVICADEKTSIQVRHRCAPT